LHRWAYTRNVLILPPGHDIGSRRRLTVRERWIIRSVLAIIAVLAMVVVVSIATAEHKTAGGCVDVKFPIAIGAQELYSCDAQARALCAAVDTPGGLTGQAGQAVAVECRKAGLPVG